MSKTDLPRWAVEVRINGESVLCIGSDWLSGVELSETQEQVVRNAARHLLAFVGAEKKP